MATHWRRRDYGYTLTELLFAICIGVMSVLAIWGAWKGIQVLNALGEYLKAAANAHAR